MAIIPGSYLIRFVENPKQSDLDWLKMQGYLVETIVYDVVSLSNVKDIKILKSNSRIMAIESSKTMYQEGL